MITSVVIRVVRALLLLLALAAVPAASWAKEVVALLDPNIRPYVEALAAFKESSDASIKVFEHREDGNLADEIALINAVRARKPDQVLLIGSEALQAFAGRVTDIPLLFCMVLNPEDKLKEMPPNLAGVSMNVSPELQINTLSMLMPNTRNVAVVYDAEEVGKLVEQGEKACKAVNRQLVSRKAASDSEAITLIRELLEKYSVYWMLPDTLIRQAKAIY